MTTIAWDGKTLASDRLMNGGVKPLTIKKIRRTIDGRLLGGSGHITAVWSVMDWLAVPQKHRGVKLEGVEDFTVIEIFKNGKIFEHTCQGCIPIHSRQYAIGSGEQYAMMAMYCGATARTAVLYTSKFDPCTGKGMDALSL